MSYVIVISFLFLALAAYTLLGGADFGVGLLETFAPARDRPHLRTVGTKAIAPVWEANHIWIIVALVVLFVGFPRMHVTLMTTLHIPMVLMLIGIVLRGTAFAFRYYQLGESAERALPLWNALFRLGNVLVPVTFGMISAALSQGELTLTADSFQGAYLTPWIGAFPIATGVFVTCLFGWIAAVFLCGELTGEARTTMVRRARRWTAATLIAGAAVSVTAWLGDNPWLGAGEGVLHRFGLVALGSLGIIATWIILPKPRVWLPRVLVGGTVFAVVGGYFLGGYPQGIMLRGGAVLTWPGTAAPEATLQALAVTLVVASVLILPGLGWLYRIFKTPEPESSDA